MSEQKIDWTKPVRMIGTNRTGRVLCTGHPGDFPVAVWWEGRAEPNSYTLDGRENIDGPVDVENIPQPTVLWCNYYGEWRGHRPSGFCTYGTRDMADLNASLDRTALYRLEISEDGKTITGERVE